MSIRSLQRRALKSAFPDEKVVTFAPASHLTSVVGNEGTRGVLAVLKKRDSIPNPYTLLFAALGEDGASVYIMMQINLSDTSDFRMYSANRYIYSDKDTKEMAFYITDDVDSAKLIATVKENIEKLRNAVVRVEAPGHPQATNKNTFDTAPRPLLNPGIPGAALLRSVSSSSSNRSSTPIRERIIEWEKQSVVVKDLTPYLQPLPLAKARGAFGIVTKAIFDDSYQNLTRTVAVKSLQTRSDRPIFSTKRFRNEVGIWAKLEHPNILPLLGISDIPYTASLVSPFMENGNIIQYLEQRPSTPRIGMIQGIVAGITYLHSKNIIHGDLKSPNLLVGEDGRPLLCDFGLSKVIDELENREISKTLLDGRSAQWAAVELLQSERPGASVTSASDMWAFAMVMIEIFTLGLPFPNSSLTSITVKLVIRKERPTRPVNRECSDTLWKLICCCWEEDPERRPRAEQAQKLIDGLQKQSMG